MKKSIISCILCSLIAFTLIGCGGINISFDSDDKSAPKETNQDQNTDNKQDVSNETSENKDKTTQGETKQNQDTDNNPNVTVNINSDANSEKKDVIVIRDPIPTNVAHGSFIFYNSDCSYLSKNQISNLNNFELGIARNEIFARHGYIFSSQQFRTYFNAQSWYRPITKNVTLNKIETYNVDLIRAEENRRGITWN
ncbi:YARHG domain-containing protein [Clostridium saccharobutylicum]|uniref:YARHG domain protein n=1 Tax=Clostridium saccharobutylicum DSM 13864 TaxID=1345695 RepID=U5MUK9_CLOSA|nr:YARHG domain-containing protein [Clostridium saccharobutylicum]AGX43127.1 YARHG domain protein [Clostridium saccharobutylicum DSM 13864]AQR90424.1 hypothetical protein CLOSC_21430 [Clostridium saccharobutylicum]AQS00330.1 hypothetical protein CSACC_21500 [Clostridium saccharobutylicum]AQS14313.1 hypothetical protein CLOSACC_21500 [Clostridium saccharobutylicum]MBA2907004.1 putative small lipoprotein YifL [Clostridium saccharobutylicum]